MTTVMERSAQKWSNASVACYLEDTDTRKIYGITNKHVTLHAYEPVTIKKKDSEEMIAFARPVPLSHEDTQDIGLIEIYDDIKDYVVNKIIYEDGSERQLKLYQGSLENLFEKPVVKCRSKVPEFEVPDGHTSLNGTVLSKFEHKHARSEFIFHVKGDGTKFSEKGESGTPIAIVNDEDVLEIIGIIVGESDLLGYDTCCIFLPNAIKQLENKSGQKFEMIMFSPTKEVKIPPGTKIYCHLKALVPLENFDIFEMAMNYMCYDFKPLHSIDQVELTKLKAHEKDLKSLVYQRESLACFPILGNDSPVYNAAEKGLKACDCMHHGLCDEAEIYLKDSLKCITKCDDLSLRLFAKLLTYITWYFVNLRTERSLSNLEKLLPETRIFFDEHVEETGFPTEIGVYLELDRSRYHQQVYNNINIDRRTKRMTRDIAKQRTHAIEAAERAMDMGEGIHGNKLSRSSTVRLILIKSELVQSLLGCGYDFGVIKEIPKADILEAEVLLSEVKRDIHKAPTFQYITYLLALCDLQFRLGIFGIALSTAQTCFQKASEKSEKIGMTRAEKRITRLTYLNAKLVAKEKNVSKQANFDLSYCIVRFVMMMFVVIFPILHAHINV